MDVLRDAPPLEGLSPAILGVKVLIDLLVGLGGIFPGIVGPLTHPVLHCILYKQRSIRCHLQVFATMREGGSLYRRVILIDSYLPEQSRHAAAVLLQSLPRNGLRLRLC